MADNEKKENTNIPTERSLAFRFCQFIVNRNLLAFGLALLAQTCFPLITAVLSLYDFDVLPIDFTDIPLILFDEPSYRRSAAWTARNRDINEPIVLDPTFLNDTDHVHHSLYRQYASDYIELYYEIDDQSNILTTSNLRRIAQFELTLLRLPHFDRFCILTGIGECEPVGSLIQYLPFIIENEPVNSGSASTSTHSNSQREFNSGSDNRTSVDEEIWLTINRLIRDPDQRSILSNYFGLNTRLDTYPPFSSKLRSILRVSWITYDSPPILQSINNSSTDNSTSSIPDAKTFIKEVLNPSLWNHCQSGLPYSSHAVLPQSPIRFFYYNLFLYYDRLQLQCWTDEAYAFGSISFIFLFLWFQTRSFFLAAFGIYFVLTNFIGGNLVYRYIFDFRYFGVFNALAVFLVLAVGVDEIFVFEETWSATGQRTYPSLSHRLYDCYRKCSLSILVPTLATTIALVQTALCPLMALSCFGAFAACVVVLNYLSIIIYFPCVLIFYHYHIDSVCRYRGRGKIDSTGGNSNARTARISQRACTAYCALLRKPFAQASLLMMTALILGFLIYSSSQVSIDRNPPKLYTESHPLGASLNRKQRDYPPPLHYEDSEFVKLYMVWGLKDWDRSRCRRSEWKSCDARIVWDDNFDLNPFTAQSDLLRVCHRLRSLPFQQIDDLMIRTSKNSSHLEIGCFVEDMDTYFQKEMRSLLYEEHKHVGGLPSTQVKVEALMLHVPQIYNLTQILQNPFFYRYFEIANLYWLNDGYKFLFPHQRTHAFNMHALLVGHSINSTDIRTVSYGNYSFVYGTRLRYAAIVINTTIPRRGMRYDEGLDKLSRWEKFFENLTADIQSPQLRHSGFIISPDPNGDFGSGFWHWLVVQKVLITSAWQGLLIGIGLAFPILVIFTDDLLVGTLTTFTIVCTSVSLIGVIPLAGWKLGLLESLNLTLVADLAIDHIVHVAEGYQLSKKTTRKEKVEDLLHEAGISIISGAFTTIGASIFLLFAKIVFFMQFGLFILFTVAFSILYSLGMFVVLLALIGPEDDRYSLSRLMGKMRRRTDRILLKYVISDRECPKTPTTQSQNLNIPQDTVAPAEITSQGAPVRISKSIDDDNISSGYESAGANRVRLRNGVALKVDITNIPSSPSISGDRPRSITAWSFSGKANPTPGQIGQ